MSFLKPDLLEKISSANLFFLIFSFLLFTNIWFELHYEKSLIELNSFVDFKANKINPIDFIYILFLFSLNISIGMSIYKRLTTLLIVKFIDVITRILGFYDLKGFETHYIVFPKEPNDNEITVKTARLHAIHHNNIPLMKECDAHIASLDKAIKLRVLCQSIILLIIMNLFFGHSFSFYKLIFNELSVTFKLFSLLFSIPVIIYVFIISFEKKPSIYMNKNIITPYINNS